MAVRLLQLQRILKPTGGIYLHCDWHANAYLRILMDLIFKERNFNNEIIWHYHSGGASSKRWARKHATILFYGNGEPTRFNTIYEPYNAIIAPKRQHLFNPKGKGADDVFNIAMLSTVSKERLGYPTQKPLTLLERIITASSNEGDVVLDPFCGCGTTIDAAQKLKRHWIGIDVTWLAITEIEGRLINTYGEDIKNKYDVCGSPADLSSAKELFKKSAKEFEIWAITKVPAHPREHDGGVDGICGFPERDGSVKTIVVQVKGGGMLNPGMVRDLIGTVKNENAAIGLMITLNKPTKGMKELAIHSEPYKSDLWEREYPSIQILTVEEILNGINFDLPTKIAPFKQALRIKERAEANKLL